MQQSENTFIGSARGPGAMLRKLGELSLETLRYKIKEAK